MGIDGMLIIDAVTAAVGGLFGGAIVALAILATRASKGAASADKADTPTHTQAKEGMNEQGVDRAPFVWPSDGDPEINAIIESQRASVEAQQAMTGKPQDTVTGAAEMFRRSQSGYVGFFPVVEGLPPPPLTDGLEGPATACKRPVKVSYMRVTEASIPGIVQWILDSGSYAFRVARGGSEHMVAIPDKLHGGTLYAGIGDVVIKGVAGEFYPCNGEIFAETYFGHDAEGLQLWNDTAGST